MSIGPETVIASRLTGSWVGARVRVTKILPDNRTYSREGEISMITHCRTYTRIRLGVVDIKVHPQEIIERL